MRPQPAVKPWIFVLTAVLAVQLLSAGVLQPLLLCLQTGRQVLAVPTEENFTSPTQITQHSEETQPADAVISFSFADLPVPPVRYGCSYRPDVQALLCRELTLDLTAEGPQVLIVHTHTTEGYRESEGYRSLDEQENMLSIGDEVARVLELGGIGVIHDRTLHDHPDYNSAYSAARATIRARLAEYPTIRIVLDLHRDAAAEGSAQLTTTATVGGQASAQLMMVVGTDAGGNAHPGWQENLSLALKLTALLEQENPGITRPVDLRSQRFNMDLCPGSLLVEVGAAGDSRQQAILAANALAQAILTLAEL